MGGLGEQGKRKAARRAADLSEKLPEEDIPSWSRPPKSELVQDDVVTTALDDNASAVLKIRIVRSTVTYQIVEFSISLLVRKGGRMVHAAEIDSCHDIDFHIHQYGRSTGGRVSNPVSLGPIATLDAVEDAYAEALQKMEDDWVQLRDRWQNG